MFLTDKLYVDSSLFVGGYEKLPYINLYDTSTKTAGTARPRAIKWNAEGVKNLITHNAGDSSVGFQIAGTYLLTFSAIGVAATPADHMEFWFAKNGSTNAIAYSNTRCEFVTNNNEKLITVTFLDTFVANDYVELMWYASDPGDYLAATDASTTGYIRPASPAIIGTINMVSR